jgi:DNA-binding LacI/PurR family transcriptional regulator
MMKTKKILENTDRSRGNKYAAVADILLERIQSGVYGSMLPGKIHLAAEFEVTPVTMGKAINLLKVNGVVRTENGRGTFITRLKRKRTHVLGVVVKTLAHDAYLHNQLISSLQQHAQDIEENIVTRAHYNDADKELDCVRQLVENFQVDGIILWPAFNDGSTIEYLESESIPYVLLPEPDLEIYAGSSTVSADDAGAAFKLMEHLIATGRKKIGFVASNDRKEYPAEQERYAQYIKALKVAGLDACDPLTMAVWKDAPEWLSQRDAIFCVTDVVAASMLSCCAEHGIRVPHDLAIAGYDNSNVADYLGVTSVEQHFENIGLKAVDVLIDDIEERQDAPVHVTVESELILRKSTNAKDQDK